VPPDVRPAYDQILETTRRFKQAVGERVRNELHTAGMTTPSNDRNDFARP
jgi:hypothetical protein